MTSPPTSSQSSSSQSVPLKQSQADEWDQWRQSYATAALCSENDNKENESANDALEDARQWIIRKSKTGSLNNDKQLSSLVNRMLKEQQQEIMDRSISKPWTIRRPLSLATKEAEEAASSAKMLRQIEWHVVLLLELWIHHGERFLQQVYPQLLVLQHSRYEALRKEEKEKRKWRKRNKPKKQNQEKTKDEKKVSKPFSATAYIIRQLSKCQKVLDRTPSLTSKLQTATPQDQESLLLQHISGTLSQAAFFLEANQNMTSFLIQKCLSPRIWKALPQVVTHVCDDLEHSNPYLEKDTEEEGINILTTVSKKKKKKKKSKPAEAEPEKPAPSLLRPKLVQTKRFGHFHHRSRAAQSTMSKVLEHLSPVGKRKSSMGSKQRFKTPVNAPTDKSSRLRNNASSLVTPHANSTGIATTKKTPKLSLATPSSAPISKKPPAPVTTNKKKDCPKLQLMEPTSKESVRRPEQLTAPTREHKAARRNSDTFMPSPTKRIPSARSKGLFPLSPIPTQLDSNIAATPTRKRPFDATVWKTPQRQHECVVAETPDVAFPTPAKRPMTTPPVKDAVVAETPEADEHKTVAETPLGVVAETPLPSVAETPDSKDWKQSQEEQMEPMQLFAKPEPKKPRRRVYNLGSGKLLKDKTNEEEDDYEDEMHDRRSATQAVLSQARAFIRRRSMDENEL